MQNKIRRDAKLSRDGGNPKGPQSTRGALANSRGHGSRMDFQKTLVKKVERAQPSCRPWSFAEKSARPLRRAGRPDTWLCASESAHMRACGQSSRTEKPKRDPRTRNPIFESRMEPILKYIPPRKRGENQERDGNGTEFLRGDAQAQSLQAVLAFDDTFPPIVSSQIPLDRFAKTGIGRFARLPAKLSPNLR